MFTFFSSISFSRDITLLNVRKVLINEYIKMCSLELHGGQIGFDLFTNPLKTISGRN